MTYRYVLVETEINIFYLNKFLSMLLVMNATCNFRYSVYNRQFDEYKRINDQYLFNGLV